MQVEVFQRAAAILAQRAETVRVVDHQPGAVLLAQGQQRGQRRQVAIHAEDAVGDDDFRFCRACRQQGRQGIEVRMRIHARLDAGQARAVDQRGVVQRFRKNLRVRIARRQGRQHSQISHVAGTEIQGARLVQVGADESGQPFFQLRVGAAVATDQVRSAAAGAIQVGALFQRGDDARMRRQAQVVIAAKGQHVASIDRQARRARRVDGAAAADQAALFQPLQLLLQLRDQFHLRLRSLC